MAALAGIPGWFLPTQPEPAPTDYAAQAAAQAQWESRIDFPFAFGYRAELEKRAGGNPSWNVGVDYRHQLEISPYRDEVTALYRGAGLDLDADLAALNAGATIKLDARGGLSRPRISLTASRCRCDGARPRTPRNPTGRRLTRTSCDPQVAGPAAPGVRAPRGHCAFIRRGDLAGQGDAAG